MLMGLTTACIRKPVLAWMLMGAVVLFGLVALSRIGISQFPDVDFPNVSVAVTWEGASPEAIEHDVLIPIEDALGQVDGIKEISASARSGSGTLSIDFGIDKDIDAAIQDVQAKIGQVQRQLPKDLDPPIVSKRNPEDFPIMFLAVSGSLARRQLTDIARYQVKERLQKLPGVGDISMPGYLERSVRVWLDPARLEERGLTAAEAVAALRRQNLEVPAGRIEATGPGREIDVRVLGEAVDLGDLRRLVIAGSPGEPVRLSDVAVVEDGFEDERTLARANGISALGLGVRKQRGSNQVQVAQLLRAEVEKIRTELPPGVELGINFDSSIFVERSITDLGHEVLLAALLTGLICWLFLGSFSATLNVVLAIPMSLLGTIAVLYFCGFTLNTFTLLALALVVGLVVDDAIMVQENITRHHQNGADAPSAARRGTREIAFAALAATIAVIAIFIPVVFMDGVIGRFFLQFGVAFGVAIAFSYLEAMTLAPARCAQFLAAEQGRRGLLVRMADRVFASLAGWYRTVLGISLRRPVMVLAGVLAVVLLSAYAFTRIPKEFVPSEDQGRLFVKLDLPAGMNLAETDRAIAGCEAWLKEQPEVRRFFAISGSFGSGAVNQATMFISLTDKADRKQAKQRSQQELQEAARKAMNSIPGVKAVIQDPSQQSVTGQRGGFQIEFSLRGANWDEQVQAMESMTRAMRDQGSFTDVDSDYRLGRPEVGLSVDRAAALDLGVRVDDVANALNLLIGGAKAGKYSDGSRRLDVRVRALVSARLRPEDLGLIRVRAQDGRAVPLSSLVTIEERPTVQSIQRRDRSRAVTIYANLAKGVDQGVGLAAIKVLAKDLPAGVRLVWQGSSVQMQDSQNGLAFAFAVGVLIAYMVLGGQFNSFLHPVTVLSVLPLAVAGALGALWLTGFSLNLFSVIGMLLLMGIAKKNSIILVDYAAVAQREGKSPAEAMLYAGPIRLRPILMTSAATAMAAVPIVLGLGAGAESRQPMAVAILGGVVVSTLLSLVAVPALYVVFERLRRVIYRRVRSAGA